MRSNVIFLKVIEHGGGRGYDGKRGARLGFGHWGGGVGEK
jgi:hypothetical protein